MSSSISDGEQKGGASPIISTSTHPTLHMSTRSSYDESPSATSGGRYHTVTTRSV